MGFAHPESQKTEASPTLPLMTFGENKALEDKFSLQNGDFVHFHDGGRMSKTWNTWRTLKNLMNKWRNQTMLHILG